jgi:uncharacterized protein (TIGR02246 family)
MKKIIISTMLLTLVWSCESYNLDNNINSGSTADRAALVKMIREREVAMNDKDISSLMIQFSDDATFINSAGFYFTGKTEIENFHRDLIQVDTAGYFYKAGNVTVRIIDDYIALVYYPWSIDWYENSKPDVILYKETGLMTLVAQKRAEKWLWIAITNQHTPEFFNDLIKHTSN